MILICLYTLISEGQVSQVILAQGARTQSMADGPVILKFSEHYVLVEGANGKVIESMFLATLHEVRYQSTKGAGRIVYSAGSGDTAPNNIYLHGGDVTLRSWLG